MNASIKVLAVPNLNPFPDTVLEIPFIIFVIGAVILLVTLFALVSCTYFLIKEQSSEVQKYPEKHSDAIEKFEELGQIP